ncbi:ATP phosphoribosyltransferase [Robiginitomaculum antarcticum]|uniref:ATP phosphoribosyltransferase n=1 Tax=Robiginitomaculum antarcticum TaxID=437507 RepID=UPI00036E7A5C|nr:ATP phosphoribosyltransferase [Robiginitomaculum antarcticum]
MTERLRIAVQKKGRLADDSFALLKKCGLRFSVRGGGLLTRVKNLPIDLLLVRDDDIPAFVSTGASDLGIAGENILVEEQLTTEGGLDADVDRRLGFSRCSLCLASETDGAIRRPSDLAGTKIATTYPGVLRKFLKDQNINAKIVEMKGAVELAPSIHIAESICDLVSSGATLEANGLSAFETILNSEAVLIKSARKLSPAKQDIYDKLVRRIDGVTASSDSKYIMLNAPKSALADITAILPGADAPTVIPLAGQDDMVAVQAVCTENVFWETLEQLKAKGARSILVLPIEKMMA